MHFSKSTPITAVGLLVALAQTAPTKDNKDVEKRVFGIVEAGTFLRSMVFAGLEFMETPPP